MHVELNLNPTLLPGVTIIQPEIVLLNGTCRLTCYSDLVIAFNTIVLVWMLKPSPGVYPMQFFVENDFDAADTLVNLEVIDNPGEIVTAGPDQVFCSTPVMLEGDWTWGAFILRRSLRNHSYCCGS